MTRERPVRFCEGGGVRSPSATRLVIVCRSREEADAALGLVRCWVADNELTLHPTKTHVGDCRQPGQGFEFVMPKACVPHGATGSRQGDASCERRA